MWFRALGLREVLMNKWLWVAFLGLSLFVLLTLATDINPGNDDGWFRENVPQYSLAGWVDMRYQTWSGRVTAEAFAHTFSQLPVAVWRVANIAMYAMLVFCLCRYYALLVVKRSERSGLAILALCTIAPLMMGAGALLGGALWITGSFFYLWIVALGLVAFYPVLYMYLKRVLPPRWLMAAGIVAAALAGFGQEQVFALLTVFTGLAVAGLSWQTRRVWLYPILQLAVIVVAATLSYLAPGNKLRMEAETATWLPTFHTAPFLDRLEWSLRWFMDATINRFGVVLILLWALIILLVLADVRRRALDWRDKIVVSALTTAVVLHIASPVTEHLTDFHAQWGATTFPTLSYFVLAFWLTILAATIAGLHRVSDTYLRRRFLLPLVGLGSLAATAMITLSPTMYASEQRTLFVPGILMVLLVIVLAAYAFKEHWTRRYLLFAVLSLAVVVNLAALLAHRSHFFQTLLG